ncbi:unnamed protein product [Linum trigynum]|uniref:Uncharacterized protein n=1 Tax=Linum trigynum TaxID=586398 RepID=A0AAV2EDD4_9ROSI
MVAVTAMRDLSSRLTAITSPIYLSEDGSDGKAKWPKSISFTRFISLKKLIFFISSRTPASTSAQKIPRTPKSTMQILQVEEVEVMVAGPEIEVLRKVYREVEEVRGLEVGGLEVEEVFGSGGGGKSGYRRNNRYRPNR